MHPLFPFDLYFVLSHLDEYFTYSEKHLSLSLSFVRSLCSMIMYAEQHKALVFLSLSLSECDG